MTSEIERLQDHLSRLGAELNRATESGAFSTVSMSLNRLDFDLIAEYGSWRVNIRYGDGTYYPASFWVAALMGRSDFPEPVVTAEDVATLDAAVEDLVGRADVLTPTVQQMGMAYSNAMRERFG